MEEIEIGGSFGTEVIGVEDEGVTEVLVSAMGWMRLAGVTVPLMNMAVMDVVDFGGKDVDGMAEYVALGTDFAP